MTERLQEIFDKVYSHMLAQNAKSLSWVGNDGGVCAYRGADGMKCAAGVLIPDDLYHPEFEGESVDRLADKYPALADALHWNDEGVLSLVGELQDVHDSSGVESWPIDLASVAKRHGLYCPEPT